MLQLVDIGSFPIALYEPIVGRAQIDRLKELAEPLKGCRVTHINATSYGGGVSELLRAAVPLIRDLGIDATWQVIYGAPPFFEVTKKIHNALQGARNGLTAEQRETYLMHNRHNAGLLEDDYDFIVVHDPQPAALRRFQGRGRARWLWRCHIDTSDRNEEVWKFLEPFIQEYDTLIFTMPEFVPPDFASTREISIVHPAIDPLSPKNMPLPEYLCQRILQWVGVDTRRPLVTQVSRFDPWKDPFGTLEIYRRVREKIPGLQLALLGHIAGDDPEGWTIYGKLVAEVKEDPDIHLFTNYTAASSVEVNAFQRHADVVIQKSIREGFGLVVSETLWKTTPVVGGRTGGIPMQMPEGVGGFLVDSVEEAVPRVQFLLENPREARELGMRGRRNVLHNYLITRYVEDELRLLNALIDRKGRG